MTKIEIGNGNDIIANFWGYKKYKEYEPITKHNKWLQDKYFVERFPSGRVAVDTIVYDSDELKFHKSFGWLIPVVKKCKEVNPMAYKGSNIESSLLSLDIEKLWKSVVEFIEWYNNKK